MTQPSTGTTFEPGGFGSVDSRMYQRGGLAAVLVRDNRGAATNISPYSAVNWPSAPTYNWSPFAQDGTLRADLFAQILNTAGQWQLNTSSNQGFYFLGALDEKGGMDRKPGVKHDDAMILQSNFPFSSDITGEGVTVSFHPVQPLSPLVKRLRMNLPLSDSAGNALVELPGINPYIVSKPVDPELQDRQLVFIFARKVEGNFIYTAELYPLCRLTDIGNYKRDKVSPDSAPLTFTILPDPFYMDLDPSADAGTQTLVPALYGEIVSGPGWLAIGGGPVMVGTPIATTTAATTANIELNMVQGGKAPITYTATKATTPFSSFTSVTVGSVSLNTPTAGDVTLHITGLTTATGYQFKVIATDSTSPTPLVATSAATATITTD